MTPFFTFFDLTGSKFQFALLAVVLIASLFLKRPWCTYLCPLRAVTDYIKMIREWVIGRKSGGGSRANEVSLIG